MIEDLLFCEPVVAGPRSPWCLRFVGEKGEMYGGGIDTPSLCGLVTPEMNGWDIDVPVTPGLLENTALVCQHCLAFLEFLE
jgi:hypothetical protein